jgi:large subunit ribosomal protein L4
MLTTKVFDMTGKEVGTIELPEEIFGIRPDRAAMHEAVKNHLANRRRGTQSALTRSEVSGGGRKPWRQKGTGRARHGSSRAPQWTHGGVAFAPKPRDYKYRLNKKYKRLALLSALSSKAAESEIIVIDSIKFDAPKTKDFVNFLSSIGVEGKALVLTARPDRNTALSARNVLGVKTMVANTLNTYDVLKYGKLVFDKAALEVIGEVFRS